MYSGLIRNFFLLGQVKKRTTNSTVKITTAKVSILRNTSRAQRAR